MDEPLCVPSSRLSIFPLQDKEAWAWYKKMEASFWTVEEVDLSKDMAQYDALPDAEKWFLDNILAFFNTADNLVIENLTSNFMSEITSMEVEFTYNMQRLMEQIHAEMYSTLIEAYVRDGARRAELLADSVNSPVLRAKISWCQKWMNPEKPFPLRLLAFSVVEGVFFSSSFAGIYYFRKRGMMDGLCFSNELIARDEGMHTDFACFLLNERVENKPQQSEVHELIRDAVAVEKQFVQHATKYPMIGMNSDMLTSYVEFVADRLLFALGYDKIYNTALPDGLDFMVLISLQGKTNFFEKRVGEYAKSGVAPGTEHSHTLTFGDDDDF